MREDGGTSVTLHRIDLTTLGLMMLDTGHGKGPRTTLGRSEVLSRARNTLPARIFHLSQLPLTA